MNTNPQEIANTLRDIEQDIDNGDLDTAKQKTRILREKYNLEGSPSDKTIGINIDIWPYDYKDDIYFATSDHSSIMDAVADLVASHIPKLTKPGVGKEQSAASTAADIRKSSKCITSSTYEQLSLDEEISIHADVYYMRASVHYNKNGSGNINRPSPKDIVSGVKTVLKRAGNNDNGEIDDPAPHTTVNEDEFRDITDF
jgi:hypothetical protein